MLRAATTHRHDYLNAYVSDLVNVPDMDAIRGTNLHITVVNDSVDPTFRFITADRDGRRRMDPSSIYAMQNLIGLKDRFDIAFACDADHDRHGVLGR